MDDEAPALRRIRADLSALDDPRGAQAHALSRVLGWAEFAEYKEGAPFLEGRVPSLVALAVQRFEKEATTHAGRGDTDAAAVARASAAALTPYL
ncbi:hypothetical protein ACWFNE_00695 [Cellulomonas sp. NPDC055163]